MGAVVGVEENIKKFEAAMASLANSGESAFLEERLTAAESYPAYMDVYANGRGSTQSNSVSYGGFTINVYQQPGEDGVDLAERIRDILQTDIIKEEASLSAY